MRVLVTGGAGYIGSHMVRTLSRAGHTPIVVDDLSSGHRDCVAGVELIVGDVADRELVVETIGKHGVEAVLHFAGRIVVPQSIRQPAEYYRANVVATFELLEAMRRCAVDKIVFSSSAAIYAMPAPSLIAEEHPQRPASPYGHGKAQVEQILRDYATAYGLRSVSLRYFNAAGACPDGGLGERHDPETHLIPLVLEVAAGRSPTLSVFGEDYATPDGSCIRDFVHVVDLCQAHLRALEWLENNEGAEAFNLGSGRGHSVREVIRAAERVTGREVALQVSPRRPGDAACLVADPRRAQRCLRWDATRSDLATIIEDAWRWHATAAQR